MTDDLRADNPQQEVLHEVLASYLEAIGRGEAVDRHTLVANHPNLTEELTSFFEAHDHATRLADSWRTSEGGDEEITAVAFKKRATDADASTTTWESPTSSQQATQRGNQSDDGLRAAQIRRLRNPGGNRTWWDGCRLQGPPNQSQPDRGDQDDPLRPPGG